MPVHKYICPTLFIAATALLAPGAMAAEAWRTPGFSVPESVTFDDANQRLIVSNIVGDATAADGNGTLSLVGLDGAITQADWVKGLDAPKGSAIAGGKLFVADITNLRIVDLATGAMETMPVEGATFLNDVAADASGNVYVTDTFANRIYRYADGKAELFVEDAALQSPNGIMVDGDTLVIASFGTLAEKQEDMRPGGIVTIDMASKAVTKNDAAGDFGFLDGIVKIGDVTYVSDFFAGKVYKVVANGPAEPVATLVMGSADIGTDGTAIFVPMMMEGELVKLTLD